MHPKFPLSLIFVSVIILHSACKREVAEPLNKSETTATALATITRFNFMAGSPTNKAVTVAQVGHLLPFQATAKLNRPAGVISNGAGGVWISDYGNNQVKYISNGKLTLTIGTGNAAYQDGPATVACFNHPAGIAFGPDGLLYLADRGNNRIRIINPTTGAVSTFAGSGVAGFADGPLTIAKFNQPAGIAIDAYGTFYIADQGNNMIRRITGRTTVTRWCGQLTPGSADGAGAYASFNQPLGVALSPTGSLYVADLNNNKIRKVTGGVVTTFAGSGQPAATDGNGVKAAFNWPAAVATDSTGNVYVTDYNNAGIRFITPAGQVSTIAGGSYKGNADGWSGNASFTSPNSITVDPKGAIYITDEWEPSVRTLTFLPAIKTLAGGNQSGYREGTGSNALFGQPKSMAAGPDGTLYVVDAFSNGGNVLEGTMIRTITPLGETHLIAGGAINGYVDGPAAGARFARTCKIAVAPDATIYIADKENNRIRKISKGIVSTFAGDGQEKDADGIGTHASIQLPTAITTDAEGNVYVASDVSGRLCRITPAGAVITIHNLNTIVSPLYAAIASIVVDNQRHIFLGLGRSIYEYTADNKEGVLYYNDSRLLNYAMTYDGVSLYLGSAGAVFKLTPDRKLVLLGGNQSRWRSEDGPISSATIYWAYGLALSPDKRTLYMTEEYSSRVRMIDTNP